jgi:hypothetical protein
VTKECGVKTKQCIEMDGDDRDDMLGMRGMYHDLESTYISILKGQRQDLLLAKRKDGGRLLC